MHRQLPRSTEAALNGQSRFNVADGYLFTVTNWAAYVNLDLSAYANLTAYRARIAARPAVVATMKAEGLIK